jgi:hypothetical protein
MTDIVIRRECESFWARAVIFSDAILQVPSQKQKEHGMLFATYKNDVVVSTLC